MFDQLFFANVSMVAMGKDIALRVKCTHYTKFEIIKKVTVLGIGKPYINELVIKFCIILNSQMWGVPFRIRELFAKELS